MVAGDSFVRYGEKKRNVYWKQFGLKAVFAPFYQPKAENIHIALKKGGWECGII